LLTKSDFLFKISKIIEASRGGWIGAIEIVEFGIKIWEIIFWSFVVVVGSVGGCGWGGITRECWIGMEKRDKVFLTQNFSMSALG
jgi:hypothetical protein